ncbi:efflux RND transporter periplasmic adaptor subunit [Porphyromonas gingivalis]|uniref:efflux RND transporter periplasmic adaptor subunit n=1 Tax=Porphyromonas gingivalis TaxID=837 RepID=UPI001F2F03E6|nr:efflux RND transporter periplasmic adaptor subunit [Porphyromonas gingivalis]MCE8164300.1 efflux RND transporter periplasmic adaptor subunit [Porphyromonas gingivalis]MCE8179819.1 efflux RND transporter periplasmic adaptor subunit [Porphyromonas gingivalis]
MQLSGYRVVWLPFIFLMALSVVGCNGGKKKTADTSSGEDMELFTSGGDTIDVQIAELKLGPFDRQIVSHGKLRARETAVLQFEDSRQPLHRLYVRNGQHVVQGQKIAAIDDRRALLEVQKSEDEFKQRELDLQDVLVGMGYSPHDKSDIPADKLALACIKSGYNIAESNYKQAQLRLKHVCLTAPISGVVADLHAQEHTIPESGKPLCRIIGDNGFEVVFEVLESELSAIRTGERVEIRPVALRDVTAEGVLQEINPSVDDRGMVQVSAGLRNPSKSLFDGMNVEVRINQRMEERMVIPKSAVVLRSDKPVVFSVRNGTAAWNYVDIEAENAESYCIVSKTLKPGEMIVVDGNANLAHKTPVALRL